MLKNDSSYELFNMIADYMEKGFLDNIIDMFKYDENIYPVIKQLIQDERMRVRIGAIALVEALAEINFQGLNDIADSILPLLNSESPTIRGDALHCLSIIGIEKHIEYIKRLRNDSNAQVREIAIDAIEDIQNRRNNTI
ncbi:glutaredoxin [Candidatus Magnetoovum chiemensis]|nr:glutaredoxin [Candidatus Magnetoovum chiemensis]